MEICKKITSVVLAAIILAMFIVSTIKFDVAASAGQEDPKLMRVTCYYGGEVTKSGQKPRYGICAGPEELIGYLAIVYDKDMEFIGYWEVLDTGSHQRLKDGSSIDIWQPTLDECNRWIEKYGDYCYVQLINAEG